MPDKQNWWEWEISSSTSWTGVDLKELYAYKDLLFRLVRKDFLSSYQQTLLGPFWVVFQPILTVITYLFVFHEVIGIGTDGVPALLFYLTGITLWNLFADIFSNTSYAYAQSITIFEKVYFPRIIAPLSILALSFVKFGIQFLLLIIVAAYFYLFRGVDFNLIRSLASLPVIIIISGIGFGAGLIFSIITIKYKDFFNLLQLFIRLFMFICPIFYSIGMVPSKAKTLVNINPLSVQFEIFRYAVFGKGTFNGLQLLYSTLFMVILVFAGVLVFNKWSDKLIDVA